MEQVVIEWTAEQSRTREALRKASDEERWCHRIYNVKHLRSYLGSDGRQIVCVFAAPDAEAVRRTARRTGTPIDAAWTATVHTAPEAAGEPLDGRQLLMVGRRFDEPANLGTLARREQDGAWCLQQHGVRHLRSYFSTDHRRLLCLYEAPDAESVRLTQRQVGLPFDRVWQAVACTWTETPETN